MIVTILLLLVLASVTGLLVLEGLWRSVLTFFNVLFAASVATAWFGPLANLLESRLPSYAYLLDFLAIWLIFCVVAALTREAIDRLAPTKVAFPVLVERIGVGIPAFLAGWVMMAFTATTLHTAAVPRDFVQPTPEARLLFGLAPDRKWLSWVRAGSQWGPFSRGAGKRFDDKGDFILRYADRRLKLEGQEALRTAAN